MDDRRDRLEELLLDLHLGCISDEDRLWLEAQLERDGEVAAKADRLGKALGPLDHWTVPPIPDDLVDRALDRIAQHAPGTPNLDLVTADHSYAGRSFRLPLREVLAVAACIGLLISVLVPGLAEVRDRSQRAACARNLASIFDGARMYQEQNAGALPFAGEIATASWLPTGASKRQYASNSRHPYLLVKLEYGPKPEHFVCPADADATPLTPAQLAGYNDFKTSRHNSYDSLNLSGSKPNVRPGKAIAYLGDRNPLFRNGRFDASVDPTVANSLAHGGRGQTVLTLDGSAGWMTSPVYGTARDNVWMAGDIRNYTGVEAPLSDDDAQLVPGYPTTDPNVQELIR